MANERKRMEGAMGAPPPDAPRETAQPLSAELLASQLAMARANERELGPATPISAPKPPVSDFFAAPTAISATPPPEVPEQPPLPPPLPHQRAASDTDSPSRGLPRGVSDPGKAITGGFGDVGAAEYFPLDGAELRTVIEDLLVKLAERLQDDLRFTLAVTYPRVTARVEIHVEGFAEDQGFVIPRVGKPHDKTPVAVAREHGDAIVFVLTESHVEMTPEGESVTPPNKARLEAGLIVPRKQSVDVPGGRVIVDVLA